MEQQMAPNWADGFVPNQESMRLDHMTVNPAELSKIVRPDFNMDDDMFSGVHDSLKYLPDLSRLQSEFPLSTLADPNSEMQGQDIDTISMPPFDANLNHSQMSGPFGDASQYALDYEETARQAPPHVQQGYEAPMYDMGFGSHYGPQSFNKGYMQLGSSMSISMTNNLPSNQVSFSSEPSNFASHGTIDSQTKELTPAAETPKASRAVAYLRRKEKTRYRRSVSRATLSPLPSSSPRENSMSHHGTSNSSISEESQSSHHIDAQKELNMLDKTFKPTSTFAQRKKAHLMKELEDKLAETLRQLKELMIDDEKFGGSSDVESNHTLTSTVPSSKVSASASEILESDASADNTSVSSTPRQPENIPASVEDRPPPCRHKPCQKCPFSTLYHCTYKGCGYATHQFADFVRHEGGDGHWPQNRFMCLECCPGSTNSTQEAPKDENGNSICVFCLLPFSLLPGTATQHFLECTAARNDATTFGRVDHLIEHRRDIHGIAGTNKVEQKEVNKTTASWKYPIESEWPRQCGTCGAKFTTWDERMKHLAEHFQEEFRKKSKRPFPPPKDFTPGPGPSRKDDDDDDDDTPNGGNCGPRRYAPGQQGQSQTVAAQNSSSKSSQGQRSQGRHHNQTRDVYACNLYGQTALHLASNSSLALQRYLNDPDEPFATRWSLGLAPKYDNKSRVKDLLALIRERQQHLTNVDRQRESPSEDDESELRSATKQELVPGLVFKENVGALHVSPGHKYNVYLEAAALLRGARFIPSLNTIPMNIVHWWEEATPPSVRKTISEGSIRDEPDISDSSKLGPRSPFPALAQDSNHYNDEFCVQKARVGTTDTVSIYGLNRDLYSSWQEKKASSLNWPLGHSKARDIALMKCFDAIIKEPNEPLVSHQNMRTGDVEGYPIIFVAHSLGGIVVKQALGLLQEAHVKTVSNFLPRCSSSMEIPSYCRSKALVAELDEIVQSHLARDIHDKDRYSRLLEQVAPVSGDLTVLSALSQHMNNVQRDQNPGNIFELEVVNILPAYGILQIADFGIGKFHNLHSGTGTEPARGTPPCTAPRNKILSVYLDGSRHVGGEPSKLSTSYNHSPLSTGSPAYQAPELLYDIGHAERLLAVDVWSLGAILSEAATWNNHHQTLLGKSKWEEFNSEILQGSYLEAVDLQCMHSSGTNNNYCPILRWHQTCFEGPRVQHLTKHICEELEIALRADNHHEQADSMKRKANWIRHENERHRHLMDAMVSPESCQESHPSAAISESWDEVDLEVNFHPTQCLLSGCRGGYIFKTLQSYRSHLKNVHDKGIYCRVLGCRHTKPFASKNDVDRHYRAKYDLYAVKSFRSERPSCVARVRSWKRKDKLREHDRKYHMEVPCHICSHYFDNDQELFEHTNLDHAIYDQRLDKFGRAIFSTMVSPFSLDTPSYELPTPKISEFDGSSYPLYPDPSDCRTTGEPFKISSVMASPQSIQNELFPEWANPAIALSPSIIGSDYGFAEYGFDPIPEKLSFSTSSSGFVEPSILYGYSHSSYTSPALPQESEKPAPPPTSAFSPESRTEARNVLLEEFRSNSKFNKRYELKDLYNHVVDYSGDQHGTRFIRQKLETANSDEKEPLFREIQPPYLYSSYLYPPQRRPSLSPFSSRSYDGNFRGDESKERGRCTYPDCGNVYKDLKAHMLTHQNNRPEKCPMKTCEYHVKGFVRKYDKNRHTLTHYKGTMVCGFCPGNGSASEKSFNRADVFKRHLTSVHGVEQTPPNSRKRLGNINSATKLSRYAPDATSKCSTCSGTFSNAQDFYDHLDACVLRIVNLAEPLEAINLHASAPLSPRMKPLLAVKNPSPCPISGCSFQFGTPSPGRWTVDRHILTHHGSGCHRFMQSSQRKKVSRKRLSRVPPRHVYRVDPTARAIDLLAERVGSVDLVSIQYDNVLGSTQPPDTAHNGYSQRLDKFGHAISTASSASSCRRSMYASDKPIIYSRDSSLSFVARRPGASYHSASELPPISPLPQIPRGPDSISAPKKGRDPESQRIVVGLDYATTFTRVTYSVVVTPLKLATFYENHRETSEDHPPDKSELLHVVGMAGRFPEAASREKLRELLEKGLDVHRVAPKDRLNAETHYHSTGKIKNTSHTPYRYWIDNPGLFDPRFFNMSPREASQTDPMQRMALYTAYETLEMASPTRIRPTKLDHIGNFFGQTSDDWREINRAQEVDTYFITSGVRAFGPGRNYHFEFSAPSFNIDTTGSSNQLGHQISLPLLSVKEAQKLLLLELDKREPPSRYDTNYFIDLVQSMGFLPVVTHAVAQRMKARDDPFSNFAKGYTCKARLGGLGMYTTVVDQPKSLSNLRSTDCQNHGDVEDQAVHETLCNALSRDGPVQSLGTSTTHTLPSCASSMASRNSRLPMVGTLPTIELASRSTCERYDAAAPSPSPSIDIKSRVNSSAAPLVQPPGHL
ncbi:uncharacterized protein PAC_11296 [Phialocephala subalpina]|uniref:Protein kinase domain-containing protein n=1 Tax=Phialocephala subalpina TaxID=576137 RepID=A0A1L7X8Q5_9HELO|nr:uncharacterized protein PAC_11296 [Phialocephala subalpina]